MLGEEHSINALSDTASARIDVSKRRSDDRNIEVGIFILDTTNIFRNDLARVLNSDKGSWHGKVGLITENIRQYQEIKDIPTQSKKANSYLEEIKAHGLDCILVAKKSCLEDKHNSTIKILENVLEKWREVYSEDDPNIIFVRNTLATILAFKGDYQKSMKVLEATLEIENNTDNPLVAPYMGDTLLNKGIVHNFQSQYPEAEFCLSGSLDIYRNIGATKIMEIATSLKYLGIVNQNLGNPIEANQYFDQAARIFAKLQGNREFDYYNVSNSKNELGVRSYIAEDYKKAQEIFLDLLEDLHEKLDPTNPTISKIQSNLAMAMAQNGKQSLAKKYLRAALKTSSERTHRDYPCQVTLFNNLGAVYCTEGKWNDAETYFSEGFNQGNQKLAPSNPRLISISKNRSRIENILNQDKLLQQKKSLLSKEDTSSDVCPTIGEYCAIQNTFFLEWTTR